MARRARADSKNFIPINLCQDEGNKIFFSSSCGHTPYTSMFAHANDFRDRESRLYSSLLDLRERNSNMLLPIKLAIYGDG